LSNNHPNRNWRNRWAKNPADYVREFRERHALSQQQLADALGVSKRRIEDVEQGLRADPLFPRALRDLERELNREQ
jgi:transcriptional regulator with XRE-family HTH domain